MTVTFDILVISQREEKEIPPTPRVIVLYNTALCNRRLNISQQYSTTTVGSAFVDEMERDDACLFFFFSFLLSWQKEVPFSYGILFYFMVHVEKKTKRLVWEE